ncbi:MAG: HEAT repeat domain-containing protein [Candidatus Sulfotelmatobacter sp.]
MNGRVRAMSVAGIFQPLPYNRIMDAARQKFIDRARELNTSTFSVDEIQNRIDEVCSEYLIEAKVDVDRLLMHDDWRVRSSALDIVAWGIGATDGIETSIEILTHDPDEDVRVDAALALYTAARGTPKKAQVREALKRSADADESDYVRESALNYLQKLNDHC